MKRKWMIWIAAALSVSLAACTGQSIVENKIEIIETEEVTTQPQTESCIVISPEDLAGPWHLDSEKNNLDAITAAWETFPGYAEWGASMEIRSNGQMSWYIGAVGGSGTYTIDGDILHAELMDSMEQTELSMDFTIMGADELKMTYADMQFIWAYGDQEDVSVKNEGHLPGPEIAELVNMRGDEATVYKLADGTYMDRIERRFIYNGTDTWTDEDGVEWNEKAY